MTETEHLLVCLAEEAAEVAQACDKALRFGLDDGWPERKESNRQEIVKELSDLYGVVRMLRNRKVIPERDDFSTVLEKQFRVVRWMEYARSKGTIAP